jgi:hypothetical protein
MKTEDLIAALERDAAPVRRGQLALRMAIALVVGGAVSVMALLATLGIRPDIGTALWPVMAKAGFGALVAVAALRAGLRLARPDARSRMLLPVLVILAGALILAAAVLTGEAPGARFAAWTGGGFPWCLVLIPAFALPVAAGLVWAMREAAPGDPAVAGAGLGALAGSCGAMVYAMYCPVDSAAFVGTWYGVAIAIAAAGGALLGARLLRW